jgi:trehalose 6-phosphate phosphatase
VPGSFVEHNNFCVSAHYRNCPGDTWLLVVKAVEETLAGQGKEELRITRGRKVMEIRPKVGLLLRSCLAEIAS